VRGGRVKADERSAALEQDYAPEVDRPRTQEEQDTLGREEGTKQGLTDPECVKGVFCVVRIAPVQTDYKRPYDHPRVIPSQGMTPPFGPATSDRGGAASGTLPPAALHFPGAALFTNFALRAFSEVRLQDPG
jgi:hypothetical protein